MVITSYVIKPGLYIRMNTLVVSLKEGSKRKPPLPKKETAVS